MKSQFIALAIALAFSGGAFAQSATDSNTSGSSSNSSYGSTPSSNCESMTGAEKTQCLRDQAGSQTSRPSEVPASTGASTSSDSKPSDSKPSDASSSSGGTSDSSTSSDESSKPKE